LGYAINTSRRKNPDTIAELQEFLVDMAILEKRIPAKGKQVVDAVEGIRLVKETPVRIY